MNRGSGLRLDVNRIGATRVVDHAVNNRECAITLLT
jgi:hypothetical protein